MKRSWVINALLSSLILHGGVCVAGAEARTQAAQATGAQAGADGKSKPKSAAAVLKKYAGRYELEVGLIPVSTLDVTLEADELWVKPSLTRKRRLLRKGRAGTFADEIEGTPYVFNKDEDGAVASLTFQYEGESYTARRRALPPPSLAGNTTFRLKGHAEAQVVAVAGTFNNWDQSQFLFAREGDGWVCRVDLKPGGHAYKFIVDGNWLLDPANPDTAEDAAGNLNSVLVVEPQ